ncbi:MAG: GGDEF domain-containing protein [Pseudomonadota bacterium]
MLFVDPDRVKAINDGLGHLAGDQLIIATANRRSAALRKTVLVARMSGEEFTILLDNISNEQVPVRVAERLMSVMADAFVLGEHQVVVTASIAMYNAKQQGRARWVMFDHAMQEKALRRLQLESELRLAQGGGELWLAYQPIVTPPTMA